MGYTRIGYLRRNIEEEINRIKKEYSIDVSPEIGKVLYGFLIGYKDKETRVIHNKFLEVVGGLEEYLSFRIMRTISLRGIRGSAKEICTVFGNGDEERIKELDTYFNGLKRRKLESEGIRQLTSKIPEEWLDRKENKRTV